MLNISAKTSLSPDEVMDRAYNFFVNQQLLTLVERTQHLHGTEGVIEISVGGARFAGRSPCDARTVFEQLTTHSRRKYGLVPVYVALHLHSAHKDDPGHLLVQASFEDPVEVRIETQEYEYEAKTFMASLTR